jgi:hypothetical protein
MDMATTGDDLNARVAELERQVDTLGRAVGLLVTAIGMLNAQLLNEDALPADRKRKGHLDINANLELLEALIERDWPSE